MIKGLERSDRDLFGQKYYPKHKPVGLSEARLNLLSLERQLFATPGAPGTGQGDHF